MEACKLIFVLYMGAGLGIQITVLTLASIAIIGVGMVLWKSRQVKIHVANQHGGKNSMIFSGLSLGVFLLILVYLLSNRTMDLIQT